jgi:hypothetical protein
MFLQFREVDGKSVVCMIYKRGREEVVEPVRDKQHVIDTLIALGDDGSRVGISSTLHFPEDETNDPAQIALAEELST